MNTILLQKILDILTEGLAHVGNFFKELFVSDPQDGQVIGYDADAGKWKNIDLAELNLNITDEAGPADIITLTDGAENVPMKSLVVDIVPKQASGTPTPSSPLPISGTEEVVITHTYGDNETDTHTIALPSTVYGGEVDVIGGSGESTKDAIDLSSLDWSYSSVYKCFLSSTITNIKKPATTSIVPDWLCEIFTLESSTHVYNNAENYDNSIACTNNGGLVISCQSLTGDLTALANLLNGKKLCYELATPIEYNLTPTQIKTRGGTESIFADCGDVALEYYTAIAGSIKNLVSITDDITSQVTVNTTDWSSVQYKVVKNNNVVTVYLYSATTTEHGSVELFSGLPRAAYNGPVLLYDTDNSAVVNAKVDTSGYLDVTLASGGTVKGTITYVAK